MVLRETPENHELRGWLVRIYPTAEQIEKLQSLETALRHTWNRMCWRAKRTRRKHAKWAVLTKQVEPRPIEPVKDAGKAEWRQELKTWNNAVRCVVKKSNDPRLKFETLKDWISEAGVKHDYQAFKSWHPGNKVVPAGVFQALAKDYQAALSATQRGQRPPKFKRRQKPMPIRTRTGEIFRWLDTPERAPNPQPTKPESTISCNAAFHFPGVGQVLGRVGRKQMPRVAGKEMRIEGASIKRKADGWYASFKQFVPRNTPKDINPGTAIGIDVGLVASAAWVCSTDPKLCPGLLLHNRRGILYSEDLAERQKQNLPTSKLQLHMTRSVQEEIRRKLFEWIDKRGIEHIFVEDLTPDIGQRGHRHTSVMCSIISFLKQRYGDRVRAVPAYETSQRCSQCGEKSKESWGYTPDRQGECEACGHREHRDKNAARNILAKGLKSLEYDATT